MSGDAVNRRVTSLWPSSGRRRPRPRRARRSIAWPARPGTRGGNYAGELGKALDTIQKEIDESLAADEVLKAETVKDHDLSPGAVLEDAQLQTASASSLDRLWGGDKAKD